MIRAADRVAGRHLDRHVLADLRLALRAGAAGRPSRPAGSEVVCMIALALPPLRAPLPEDFELCEESSRSRPSSCWEAAGGVARAWLSSGFVEVGVVVVRRPRRRRRRGGGVRRRRASCARARAAPSPPSAARSGRRSPLRSRPSSSCPAWRTWSRAAALWSQEPSSSGLSRVSSWPASRSPSSGSCRSSSSVLSVSSASSLTSLTLSRSTSRRRTRCAVRRRQGSSPLRRRRPSRPRLR